MVAEPPPGRTTLESLEALLDAMTLEPRGGDRFTASGEPGRFERVFGGRMIAQALAAASATDVGKHLHSLHSYFVRAGTPGHPLDLAVERVRDGRSVSTRRVTVGQGERTVLLVMASYHDNPPTPCWRHHLLPPTPPSACRHCRTGPVGCHPSAPTGAGPGSSGLPRSSCAWPRPRCSWAAVPPPAAGPFGCDCRGHRRRGPSRAERAPGLCQ